MPRTAMALCRTTTPLAQVGGCCVIFLTVLVGFGAAATAQTRPDVVALDLEFGKVQQWWTAHWDIGAQLNELWRAELTDIHNLRVLGPTDVTTPIDSWMPPERRRPSKEQVEQLGALSAARFVIAGEVLEFGLKQYRDGIIPIPAPEKRALVTIRVRLVDAATGLDVVAATGTGEAPVTSHLLEHPNESQTAISPFLMKSAQFRDTPLGIATAAAIADAAKALAAVIRGV